MQTRRLARLFLPCPQATRAAIVSLALQVNRYFRVRGYLPRWADLNRAQLKLVDRSR